MRARLVSTCAGSMLVLLALVGCTGASDPEPECRGGDVRILQGQPKELPGGGSTGFGDVDADAHPPTARLVFGGTVSPENPGALVVGDTFTVEGTEYEVTCISASVVTLDQH